MSATELGRRGPTHSVLLRHVRRQAWERYGEDYVYVGRAMAVAAFAAAVVLTVVLVMSALKQKPVPGAGTAENSTNAASSAHSARVAPALRPAVRRHVAVRAHRAAVARPVRHVLSTPRTSIATPAPSAPSRSSEAKPTAATRKATTSTPAVSKPSATTQPTKAAAGHTSVPAPRRPAVRKSTASADSGTVSGGG